MNQHFQIILNIIQQSEHLSAEEKNNIIKSLKDANNELEITSFKLDSTEKVKHTTATLLEETIEELEQKRKAVKVQNRELEIESSLERVRTVAMSMKEAGDMLDVCRIISAQLELLNIREIRNIQTAIFYKEKGTYMNYEYYAKHDKQIITETSYTNSEMHTDFAAQMMKGAGEFFTTNINGDEVKDWIAHQKTTNVFIDDYLYTASSLNYYWFSLGPVALGISTYSPLSQGETNLFKRFVKVFELAYRRYLDIEKAEAAAREAQVEAALEKVRSRSLAVQHSNEFKDVITIVFEKLQELGIVASSVSINIFIGGSKDAEAYICGQNSGELSISHILLVYFDHPISNDRYNAQKSGVDFFSKKYPYEEKNSFFKYLFETSDLKLLPDDIKKMVFEGRSYTVSLALAKNSMIVINDFEGHFLSEKDINVVKRFSNVFEQAYIRFLDLQKAEAQARESQIELALERVRARTMAMQKSDELKYVATLLFQQAKALGVPAYSCGYNIWEKEEKEFTSWMSTQDGSDINGVPNIPLTEDVNFIRYVESKQNGEPFFVLELHGERMQEHYEYLKTIPAFKGFFDYAVSVGFDLPQTQIHHVANFSQGNLLFITLQPCPEFHDVFKRFAAVFEQTYTRFLDLQKAEVQAREAQIEAALERVRSRTMGMQKSEELKEVIQVVYEQFVQLNILIEHTGFIMDYKAREDMHIWLADQRKIPSRVTIPYFDSPHWNSFIEAKEKDIEFFSNYLSFEEKNRFYQELFKLIPGVPDDAKEYYFNSPALAISTVLLENVGLYIENFSGIPYTDEENNTLMRFGKVFQQTYTRFLDLQKAEAQARESQIQLALERVRARTMAMQKSDELADVATLLFRQVNDLGIKPWTAGFNIWSDDNNAYEDWIASPSGGFIEPYIIDAKAFSEFKALSDAKKSGTEFFILYQEGEVLKETYKQLSRFANKNQFEKILEEGFQFPSRQFVHLVFGSKVSLMFITYEPVPEAHDIFIRFGKVFEQTYTRFLDLQKAEAQAREATIEAGLDRVRSVAMSMMNSDELIKICEAVFKQLQVLGFTDVRAAQIYIRHDEDEKFLNYDYSDISGADVVEISYNSHPNTRRIYDVIRDAGDALVDNVITKKELDEWKSYLYNTLGQPPEKNLDSATELHYYLYSFGMGAFGICTFKSVNDYELQILKRFRNVFSLSYQRYADIALAEGQAREAKIEAALERVRSRTLAMQRSDELAETSAVLFKQLILLGIEPNRLYISIMKDDEGEAEFWITDEDGSKVSSAYTDNLNLNASFKKMYDGWQEGRQSLVIDMQGKELQEYFGHLTALHVHFKDGLTQKRRIQYLAYFNRGFIGMAAPDEQQEETIHLLERFAAVFNLTFTRFNDLKIAEAHALQAGEDLIKLQTEKARAEYALSELKETQKQLIQSEKMASLGELTAGIAHEIQNPLNFVNNFSEVSKELLDEMKIALKNGDDNEAREIANDVIQNLEKINYHGKRADAIVKGMLQHSRSGTSKKELTNVNVLCDEYIRLCYHGLRSKDNSFNAVIKTDFDPTIEKINIIPQNIGRVILNVLTNAFFAMNEKKKTAGEKYKPTVSIQTKKSNDKVQIIVEDNGNGIPQKILDKIFQPFFTTKPTGQGTGLGLSLSYDIIKTHGGEIKVETTAEEGSKFIIQLPITV